MTYYVGNMPVGDHLMHYGTKGMKWGRRRYQNPDGSLTAAGRVRYGVSNAYRSARDSIRRAGGFRKATNDGRRLGKQAMRGWYKRNKKTIKKVGTAVGVGAAAAGATYLGMRYGKNALKVAKGLRNKRIQPNALKNISKAQNAYSRFKSGASAFGSKAKNAGRHAAGATSNAFRGVGYQARRTGAKAKNAARNLGYMAGNVKGNAKRAAGKAGTAAKNAAYKAGSKAKTTAAKAKNAARNAKNIPGNAKRVAYNLKNNKMYRRFAAARTIPKALDASVRVSMGAAYYRAARNLGASKKAAAAIGTARAVGGTRAGLGAAGAEGMYNFVKRANSPSAKRARARRKKKSRK